MVSDEAHAAFRMEAQTVEGDDARGFLAAMLEGVQAERGQGRRIRVPENAEYAAFFMQRIVFPLV